MVGAQFFPDGTSETEIREALSKQNIINIINEDPI